MLLFFVQVKDSSLRLTNSSFTLNNRRFYCKKWWPNNHLFLWNLFFFVIQFEVWGWISDWSFVSLWNKEWFHVFTKNGALMWCSSLNTRHFSFLYRCSICTISPCYSIEISNMTQYLRVKAHKSLLYIGYS